MPKHVLSTSELKFEIERLNKIIISLMDRAERSASAQRSDFGLFQTTVTLEEMVKRRTIELNEALQKNEKITRSLRESESIFHGLVNQSLVGIVIIEDGKLTYTNNKFNDIFGYSQGETERMSVLDIVDASSHAFVSEMLRQRLFEKKETVDYIFKGRRKDGQLIDVEAHSSVLKLSNKIAIISLLMDVTDRLHAEKEVLILNEKLMQQSTHDALTGLYNRRYLETSLDRELILAKRHGHSISLIMADIDHFKNINDQYGHLAGDEVLRFFGKLIQQNARDSDIFCRYGGEEFLLIFPTMTKDNAIKRAEKLRCAIEAARIHYDKTFISVTCSYGVSAYPNDGLDSDALIAAADSAMYESKITGRNRVTGFSISRPN